MASWKRKLLHGCRNKRQKYEHDVAMLGQQHVPENSAQQQAAAPTAPAGQPHVAAQLGQHVPANFAQQHPGATAPMGQPHVAAPMGQHVPANLAQQQAAAPTAPMGQAHVPANLAQQQAAAPMGQHVPANLAQQQQAAAPNNSNGASTCCSTNGTTTCSRELGTATAGSRLRNTYRPDSPHNVFSWTRGRQRDTPNLPPKLVYKTSVFWWFAVLLEALHCARSKVFDYAIYWVILPLLQGVVIYTQ